MANWPDMEVEVEADGAVLTVRDMVAGDVEGLVALDPPASQPSLERARTIGMAEDRVRLLGMAARDDVAVVVAVGDDGGPAAYAYLATSKYDGRIRIEVNGVPVGDPRAEERPASVVSGRQVVIHLRAGVGHEAALAPLVEAVAAWAFDRRFDAVMAVVPQQAEHRAGDFARIGLEPLVPDATPCGIMVLSCDDFRPTPRRATPSAH